MTKICPYNRGKAVAYALEWAMSRNPAYLDFEELGGDCTNFASQCLLAGRGRDEYNRSLWLVLYHQLGEDPLPGREPAFYIGFLPATMARAFCLSGASVRGAARRSDPAAK